MRKNAYFNIKILTFLGVDLGECAMWDVRSGKRSFLFSIIMKLEYFFISRLSLASSLGIINQQSSLVMRICLFYALSTVIQGYKNTFYSMLNQNPSWSIRGIRNFMLRQHPPWNIRIFFWKSIKKFFRMNYFCTWSWKLVQVAAVSTANRTVYDKIWSVVWHLMIPIFLLWNLLDLTGIGSAQLSIFQYTCSYNCNLIDNYHTNYMVSVSTFCHMKEFLKNNLVFSFKTASCWY